MGEFDFKRLWGPSPRYPLVLSYKKPKGSEWTVIAGPCSVEDTIQIHLVSNAVCAFATHLRGGVFRAGTYPPKHFGWVGLDLIKEFNFAAKKNNLKNIIELLDYRDIETVGQYADCFQVGCRQMQNYTLLKEVGRSGKTVFLKRNPGSTLDEWLGAAEYILDSGCNDLRLIERGSSTHMSHVRWDLSISCLAACKRLTDLPVLVDGSHGSGRRDLVAPMTLAGLAAGADGLLVEVHPDPEKSLSDKEQAISFEDFKSLMGKVSRLKGALSDEWTKRY